MDKGSIVCNGWAMVHKVKIGKELFGEGKGLSVHSTGHN